NRLLVVLGVPLYVTATGYHEFEMIMSGPFVGIGATATVVVPLMNSIPQVFVFRPPAEKPSGSMRNCNTRVPVPFASQFMIWHGWLRKPFVALNPIYTIASNVNAPLAPA